MTRTLVLSEHDLDAWRERFLAGEAPSVMPYGVDALTLSGHTITGARQSDLAPVRKLREVVEHRTGLTVERPLRATVRAARSDLVLALLERQGMLPGLLKRRGIRPWSSTPLVVWSCWLADDVRTANAETRARLLDRLGAADLVTHLSRHETEILVDLGIPQERLFPVTYGVSHRFYRPGPGPRDIDLLAVGQDRGRDYRTLVDAVRGTGLTLHVVCRPENLEGIDLPVNVRVHGTVPLSRYRILLRRAKVVAVPTHDLAYPTGSSVALEAASTGCAVVVTGTRAMRDYFHDGIDGRLVDEGDVDGWRAVLTELADDPAQRDRLGMSARDSIEGRFNADHMWTELAAVLVERGLVAAG